MILLHATIQSSSHHVQLKQTPLHYACSRDVDIARLLIESGASIDLKDNVRLLYVHDQCRAKKVLCLSYT